MRQEGEDPGGITGTEMIKLQRAREGERKLTLIWQSRGPREKVTLSSMNARTDRAFFAP